MTHAYADPFARPHAESRIFEPRPDGGVDVRGCARCANAGSRPTSQSNRVSRRRNQMSQTIIPALDEAAIGQLRESVRGQIFTPDSEGYEDAARIWNGAYDGRRPAVIVSSTGAADVIAA